MLPFDETAARAQIHARNAIRRQSYLPALDENAEIQKMRAAAELLARRKGSGSVRQIPEEQRIAPKDIASSHFQTSTEVLAIPLFYR